VLVARILLIDDEPQVARFVRRALEADGHCVEVAGDGTDGLRAALDRPHDLLILDLELPGTEGRTVLAALLAVRPEARVVVVSEAAAAETRVEVLEAGAVDVLTKPFSIRELVARVRLRSGEAGRQDARSVPLRVGSATLDVAGRRLNLAGREVALSPREFLLLHHLMRRAGEVCSRQELLSEVWGYSFEPTTNVVDVYVRRLRRKLHLDIIRTVRNVGYQLEAG
jgi:DNA-binding response OmpR family regulator